jgi:hypothetical protein
MKHASLRLAVVGALAALALAGCGGASTTSQTHTKAATTSRPATNGLEHQSAAQVLEAATAALKAAKSVRVTGTDGDFQLQGRSGSGILKQRGTTLAVITVGDNTWFKGDQRALKVMGLPSKALPRLAGRWVKFPQRSVEGFSLNVYAAELAKPEGLLPTVEQTMLDGRQVVVISEKDGSKLYVANTGPAYLLRVESNGKDPGRFVLTGYGSDFHITPPDNAVDLDQLVDFNRAV